MKIHLLLTVFLVSNSSYEEIESPDDNFFFDYGDKLQREQLSYAKIRELMLIDANIFIDVYNGLKDGKGVEKLKKICTKDIELDYQLMGGPRVLKNGRKNVMKALKFMTKKTGNHCYSKADNYTIEQGEYAYPRLPRMFSGFQHTNDTIVLCNIQFRLCTGHLIRVEMMGLLVFHKENNRQEYLIKRLLVRPEAMDHPQKNTSADVVSFDYAYIEEMMYRKFKEIFINPKSVGKVFDKIFSGTMERILLLFPKNRTDPLNRKEFRLHGKNATKKNVVDYFRRVQKKAGKWNLTINGDSGRVATRYERVTEGVVWSAFNMLTKNGSDWHIRFQIHEAFQPADEKFPWQINEIVMDEQY